MPIPNPTPDSMATSIPIQTWESVALAIPTFGTHDIGLMLISDGRINVSMDSGQTATLFSKTFALIKPMDVIVQAPFNVIFPSDGTCSLTFTLGIKPSTHASLQWAESQYLSFSATPGGLQLPTSIQFTQRALAPGTYTVELQVKAEGNNGYQNQPYPVNVSSGKAAAQFIANEN